MPTTDLTGLTKLIVDAGLCFTGDARIVVRSVAACVDGVWYNHATQLWIADVVTIPTLREPIDLGSVVLTQAMLRPSIDLTVGNLTSLLTHWRNVVGVTSDATFHNATHVQRRYSRPPLRPYPEWRCSLREASADQPSLSVPEGPFLKPDQNLFAPTLSSLATYWLRDPSWKDANTLTHTYAIKAEDHRGRFAGFIATGNSLDVSVGSSSPDAMYCGASVRSFTDLEHQIVVRVENSVAHFDFDYAVQALDLWLLTSTGEGIDNYQEMPTYASWGAEHSIYSRPPDLAIAEVSLLAAARSEGEGQSIEFKPFVRLRPRDPKSIEFLETACAFANASGGHLFVGISDYGDLIGVEVGLQKNYGSRCQDDLQCLQDAYVQDFRRLFSEGLTPSIIATFEWHELVHHLLLIVKIEASPSLTCLIENGEVFRRVGATNRKMRPVDTWGGDHA